MSSLETTESRVCLIPCRCGVTGCGCHGDGDDQSAGRCKTGTPGHSNMAGHNNRPEVHNTDTNTPVAHTAGTPASSDSCRNRCVRECGPQGRTIGPFRRIGLAQTGSWSAAKPGSNSKD